MFPLISVLLPFLYLHHLPFLSFSLFHPPALFPSLQRTGCCCLSLLPWWWWTLSSL